MSGALNRLSARFVATVKEPGRYADGGNLYLSISTNGGRRWVFFYRTAGRLKEMGLGSAREIALAKARERAQEARGLLADGKDPLDHKRAEVPDMPTFGETANAYVDDMAPGWSNPKHVEQWRTTLGNTEPDASKLRIAEAAEKAHRTALATLRALPVDKVETEHVLAVLIPIWQEKPETASRLRGRIEAVLAAATAKGHRSGANPALWRNHLDRLLPKRRKLSRGHHAALATFEGRDSAPPKAPA
uniref:Arm DNA-binding domain-containing protein n=1 Tax=Bosea sp. NBC_00436 TaxID=2969620 RepID=A0A9E7ZR73_9HYPH